MNPMAQKPTLSVGVPAYNEEANIVFLLKEILQQKQESFELREIIVYSDASTDKTAELVKGVLDPRVKLTLGKTRKGLAHAQNTIFRAMDADVAVLLDADTSLAAQNDFLERLASPIISGEADLASPSMEPLPPKNFFEKILFAGAGYKSSIFKNYRQGQNLYTCFGMARAFSRRLYGVVNFPYSVGEDMYSYLLCQSLGWKFKFVAGAVGNFRLPDNFRDHFRQSTRFFLSERKFYPIFGKETVQAQTRLPKNIFFAQALNFLIRCPLYMSLYFAVTALTYAGSIFKPSNASGEAWSIAESSKILKINFSAPSYPLKDLRFMFFLAARKLTNALLYLILPFNRQPKQGVIVLCYHSISNDGWRFSVSREALDKQVEYLLKYFNPVSVSGLAEYLAGKKTISRPGFVLCFDDGYRDILATKDSFKSLEVSPVVFALADPRSSNRLELETGKEFLSKQELLALKKAGWEIGSHSMTHPDFAGLSGKELERQVHGAKIMMEQVLGFGVKYFAFPKGKYNEQVLQAVRQAGYNLAFSMDDGVTLASANPLAVPRIGVDQTHSFYEFKTMLSPSAMAVRKIIRKFFYANA